MPIFAETWPSSFDLLFRQFDLGGVQMKTRVFCIANPKGIDTSGLSSSLGSYRFGVMKIEAYTGYLACVGCKVQYSWLYPDVSSGANLSVQKSSARLLGYGI